MFKFITNPLNRQRVLVATLCFASALVAGGGVAGYKLYLPRRVDGLTRAAREAVERGDFLEASLKARRALQIAPDHAPAFVLMAEICERIRNPEAVTWRERVADLAGGNAESLIACAYTALSFGKPTAARKALARVPRVDRKRADFLAVSGVVAIDAEKFEEAEAFCAEAVRVDPKNPAHRLSLGAAQVHSKEYFTREAGRRLLADLASHPAFGASALRILALSYEASNEPQAALRISQQLAAVPDHTFLDELLRLRLLHSTGGDAFLETLATLEEKAAKNGRDAGALVFWMSGANLAAHAVEWAVQRAPQVSLMPEVHSPLAGCYLMLHDWPALLAITKNGPWPQAEHIRHAYRARAFREQGHASLARTEWELAMTATSGRADAIKWLAKIAIDSGWDEEADQALWAAIEKTQDSAWAVERLGRRYHDSKNTDGLRRIAARLIETSPSDENIQNDFAYLSLLLDKDSARAASIARDLYSRHPDNAAYTSTHALALHGAKRFAEALQALEALPAAQLEQPAIALFYGLILSANRDPEKARRYLELSRQAQLLPEEARLLAKATQALPAGGASH